MGALPIFGISRGAFLYNFDIMEIMIRIYKKLLSLSLLLILTTQADAQYYEWGKYFGESIALNIKHDAGNGLYTCGWFSNTMNFNPSGPPLTKTAQGVGDIFITKHDDLGNLLWVKTMGGPGASVAAIAITTDEQKNIIITGYFNDSVDFDPGASTYFLHGSYPLASFFVEKLDSSGSFLWAKTFRANSMFNGSTVITDKTGSVYVSGYVSDTADFNPGGSGGKVINAIAGAETYFVLKLNAAGNFVWVDAVHGDGICEAYSIAIDQQANLYITGGFSDTVDFDPGPGTFFLGQQGSLLGFVQKLDSSGHFIWANALGESGSPVNAEGYAVDIDNSGNCLVTGYNTAPGDFDPGPGVLWFSNGMFTLKLDNNGNLLWGTHIECLPVNFIAPFSITHDAKNNIYRTGYFEESSVDFNPGAAGFYQMPFHDGSSGAGDIFIDKVDSNGNFLWARDIGGGSDDLGFGITLDTLANVYFCGYFNNQAALNPDQPSTYATAYGPGEDALIEKLDDICPAMIIAAAGNDLYTTSPFYFWPSIPPYYYWINCVTGDTLSQGTDSTNYHATTSGSYALIFQNDFCTIRSNCVDITVAGINNISGVPEIVKVYPIPANTQFAIEWNTAVQVSSLFVYNITGQRIELPYSITGRKVIVNSSTLSPGSYMIAITTMNGDIITRSITIEQ